MLFILKQVEKQRTSRRIKRKLRGHAGESAADGSEIARHQHIARQPRSFQRVCFFRV